MTRWKLTTLLVVVLVVTGMTSQADERSDKKPTPDREAIKRELKAAVEAGKMTEEEARAKFYELRKGS